MEAAGGPAPFVARARHALDAGENQTVLELIEILLDVRPRHKRARTLRGAALTRLGRSASNAIEANIYRSAASAPLKTTNGNSQ